MSNFRLPACLKCVCRMFKLAGNCFKKLCLSGGHPIILGKGIGKQSVKNVMNNEGMIVGFSKEIGKQFVSRM